jgi:hypothetical protein
MNKIAISVFWIGIGALLIFIGCSGFNDTRYPGWINIVIGSINLLVWGINLGQNIHTCKKVDNGE